jgi:hypothetical protein
MTSFAKASGRVSAIVPNRREAHAFETRQASAILHERRPS